MYRVSKVLNHNTVIAIQGKSNKEYLIMGKGIGFGKKVAERFELQADAQVYSLQEEKKGRDAREMVKTISPLFMEIASMLLDEAEKVFGKVDVLVNCAGSAKNNGVLNMTDEEWKFTMDTDLNSVFYVTREFANKFIENNLAYDMNNYVYLDFNFYD